MPILPALPALRNFMPLTVVRRHPAVRPDLHDAIRVARRLHHRAAFDDRVADRLLDVHVRAGLARRRSSAARASGPACATMTISRLLLLEQLAVVLVLAWARRRSAA